MKFEKLISEMARKPKMHDCYIFDEINLRDYEKDFIKAVKNLGRKVRAGRKFLNSRNRKLGEMDETFWRKYGYDIDDAIGEVWDTKSFEESGDLKKFVKSQGWDYEKYNRDRPTVGDFMC
jgi:hypothetical protein